MKNASKAKEKYGEDFVRMWDFYLSSCSAAFKSNLLVHQIETVKILSQSPLEQETISTLNKVILIQISHAQKERLKKIKKKYRKINKERIFANKRKKKRKKRRKHIKKSRSNKISSKKFNLKNFLTLPKFKLNLILKTF